MADSLIEDGTWTLRVDKVRDGLWTAFVMRHSVVHPRFRRARFVLGTSTLSLFRPNSFEQHSRTGLRIPRVGVSASFETMWRGALSMATVFRWSTKVYA